MNLKYAVMACFVVVGIFSLQKFYSHARGPLVAYITKAGDAYQASVNIEAGDSNGRASNVIFHANVNADDGKYKCYWDLGSGYGAGYDCNVSAVQRIGQPVQELGNYFVVLDGIGNLYTKVGDYIVRFKAVDETTGFVAEATPVQVHVVNKNRSVITVTAPSVGQKLKVGQSFLIKWNKDNVLTSKVDVSIHDVENRRLGKSLFGGSITNDGSENWIVKPFTKEDLFDYQTRKYVSGSGKYFILIQCIGGSPCEQGESVPFTIVFADDAQQNMEIPMIPRSNPASISIVSPSGGESWQVGSMQTIKWKGGLNTLKIALETYAVGVVGLIDVDVNASTGLYPWKVGMVFNENSSGDKVFQTVPDGKYNIRISNFKTGHIETSRSFDISPRPPSAQTDNNIQTSTTSTDISIERQDDGFFGKIKNVWKKLVRRLFIESL